MPIEKKDCINNPKYKYSGKEESPLGLGYAPDGDIPNMYMKGRDNRMWTPFVKNGVKVWVRVPDDVNILSKEEPVPVDEPAKKKKTTKKTKDEDAPVQQQPVDPQPQVDPQPPVETQQPVETQAPVEQQAQPEDPKPVEKKKVVKKKKAEPEPVPEPEQVQPEPVPVQKKKATKKQPVTEEEGDKTPPVKKALTDYQKFISWRMAQLKIEKPNEKIKLGDVAAEWKALSAEDKQQIMEKVNAA